MASQTLPLDLPLRIRGIEEVILIIFITPPPAKEFVGRAGLAPPNLKAVVLTGGCFGKNWLNQSAQVAKII
jgi:hypothetical protein